MQMSDMDRRSGLVDISSLCARVYFSRPDSLPRSRRLPPMLQALYSFRVTTVGLVGGLGPESTIDYYRRILDGWAKHDASSSPSIVIDSLDATLGLRLVAEDRQALTEYLLGSIRRLTGAGVDFIAMTANTAHLVYDELSAQSSVPMLSIVEVCAEEARRRGLARLLLLGTRFTMQADFYREVCARHGVDVVAPREDECTWMHARYVDELLKGVFLDSTREEFIAAITRLRDRERVDGIILGGTELPLLLRARVIADLPVLDTTELHVAAIVRRLRETAPLVASRASGQE